MEKKVADIIEQIRPYIRMHGGDVSLVNCKKGIVKVQISGACAHCGMANITYNKMLGALLREKVKGVKEVIIDN